MIISRETTGDKTWQISCAPAGKGHNAVHNLLLPKCAIIKPSHKNATVVLELGDLLPDKFKIFKSVNFAQDMVLRNELTNVHKFHPNLF